jgi:hypothetical protein
MGFDSLDVGGDDLSMTEIKATIFTNAEEWLRNEIPDFTLDSVAAVYPEGRIDLDGLTRFIDEEEGSSKFLYMTHYVRALRLLTEQVGQTLFVGGIRSQHDLKDGANWDVEVVDAFYQLAYHGEVIYG